jgi:hypothetical protein
MRLMRRLGVDLSFSESSEGSIGPGYENVVALPWLLVKPFGKDLHTVSSPISSGSCSASFSSSLSHIEFWSADGSVSLSLIRDSSASSFAFLAVHRVGSFPIYLQQILPP